VARGGAVGGRRRTWLEVARRGSPPTSQGLNSQRALRKAAVVDFAAARAVAVEGLLMGPIDGRLNAYAGVTSSRWLKDMLAPWRAARAVIGRRRALCVREEGWRRAELGFRGTPGWWWWWWWWW
jgi:hypothetical protein